MYVKYAIMSPNPNHLKVWWFRFANFQQRNRTNQRLLTAHNKTKSKCLYSIVCLPVTSTLRCVPRFASEKFPFNCLFENENNWIEMIWNDKLLKCWSTWSMRRIIRMATTKIGCWRLNTAYRQPECVSLFSAINWQ